jgi:hypothetical protein
MNFQKFLKIVQSLNRLAYFDWSKMNKTLFLLCLLFAVALSIPHLCGHLGVTLEYEETNEFGSENVQESSTLSKKKLFNPKVVVLAMEVSSTPQNTAQSNVVIKHLQLILTDFKTLKELKTQFVQAYIKIVLVNLYQQL